MEKVKTIEIWTLIIGVLTLIVLAWGVWEERKLWKLQMQWHDQELVNKKA